MRLSACGCRPAAYDGSSQTIVHSQLCTVHAEQPLTASEYAEWRGHPAGTATPPDRQTTGQRLALVGRFYNGRPRNERDWIDRRICDCEVCR